MAKADIKTLLYAKNKSPLDFTFDALIAPPILSMLLPNDIIQLNNIATSIRYAGNVTKKKNAITEVMKKRDFRLLASGTNRMTFKHLEVPTIVAKVPFHKVGLGDAAAEYKNQFYLKPFVTKIFEYTQCGTVSIAERVEAITSREEFLSIADDYFDMLVSKVIGKYVLEDIGTEYFMNVGLRNSWGPVLLDFPYVYELDGNKIFCNSKPLLGGPACGGVIDYDDGFNNLICTKCGRIYKAKELENSELVRIKPIMKGEDELMKVQVLQGNTVISESNSETKTILPEEQLNVKKKRWENDVVEAKRAGDMVVVVTTKADPKKEQLLASRAKQEQRSRQRHEKQVAANERAATLGERIKEENLPDPSMIAIVEEEVKNPVGIISRIVSDTEDKPEVEDREEASLEDDAEEIDTPEESEEESNEEEPDDGLIVVIQKPENKDDSMADEMLKMYGLSESDFDETDSDEEEEDEIDQKYGDYVDDSPRTQKIPKGQKATY